jgi:hypothetical protein
VRNLDAAIDVCPHDRVFPMSFSQMGSKWQTKLQPPALLVHTRRNYRSLLVSRRSPSLSTHAIYLRNGEYRVGSTNDPTMIGRLASSGCLRLTNENVKDLFNRIGVGTTIVVLPNNAPPQARAGGSLRTRRRRPSGCHRAARP